MEILRSRTKQRAMKLFATVAMEVMLASCSGGTKLSPLTQEPNAAPTLQPTTEWQAPQTTLQPETVIPEIDPIPTETIVAPQEAPFDWETVRGQVTVARLSIPNPREIEYYESVDKTKPQENLIMDEYHNQGEYPFFYMAPEWNQIPNGGVMEVIYMGNGMAQVLTDAGDQNFASSKLVKQSIYLETKYLHPITDLSPITFFEGAQNTQKQIVVIRNPQAEVILFEGADNIVYRGPAVTGHGGMETQKGRHPIYQTMVNRHMNKYNFVSFFLAFSGDQGIHGGVSWNPDNFDLVSLSDWWGSGGCVNLAPYGSEWATVWYKGQPIPIDEFTDRWAKTNIPMNEAENHGFFGVDLNDPNQQIPVIVVDSIDELATLGDYNGVSGERMIDAYRALSKKNLWKLGDQTLPDRRASFVSPEFTGSFADFRRNILTAQNRTDSQLARDLDQMTIQGKNNGLIVYDLLSNETIYAHNPTETYAIVSAFKGPLMLAVLAELQNQNITSPPPELAADLQAMIRMSDNQATGRVLLWLHEQFQKREETHSLVGPTPVATFNNWLQKEVEIPYKNNASSGLDQWVEGLTVSQQWDSRYAYNSFTPLDLAQAYMWMYTDRPELFPAANAISSVAVGENLSYLEQLHRELTIEFERTGENITIELVEKDGYGTWSSHQTSPDAGIIQIKKDGRIVLSWLVSAMHTDNGFVFQNNDDPDYDVVGVLKKHIIAEVSLP